MELSKKEYQLKNDIIKSLQKYGYNVDDKLSLPNKSKNIVKLLQNKAKYRQIQNNRDFLFRNLEYVKNKHISGKNIDPSKIDLEIREIQPNTKNSDLFRWWNLVWWSMPFQPAYGRQIRYVLYDKYHDAIFGLVQLQSPIISLKCRDEYLGIKNEEKVKWINQSLYAQRIGALPPYNDLLGGKMVTLSLTSNKIREIYSRKYTDTVTIINKNILNTNLLFITTTSAFGKSSIYDRLKYHTEKISIHLGYTSGFGTFHISEDLILRIYEMMQNRGFNTDTCLGSGSSRKMRLLSKGLKILGLNGFDNHGIQREVFLFPLVYNLHDIIKHGKTPKYINRSFSDIILWWKNRYCIPRSKRITRWRLFDKEDYFNSVVNMLNTNTITLDSFK